MSGRAAQRSDLQAEIAALRQRVTAAEKALHEARKSAAGSSIPSDAPFDLDLLPQGVACIDRSGAMTFANSALAEILQRSASELTGTKLSGYLTAASRSAFEESINDPSAEQAFVEATIQASDGRRVPVYISLRWLDGVQASLAVAVITDLSEHESRRRTDEYVDRISRLQSVTAALSEAMTATQVADVMLQQVLSAVGASAGTLHLVDDDQSHMMLFRWSGYPADVVLSNVRLSLDAELPMCDSAASREPIFLPSAAARTDRYPQLM